MKKLLALVGALTISASTATVVIACDNDKDDTKYGEVFINGDGSLRINAEKLNEWYISVYGPLGKNPNKYITQFYNFFAVSIFMEAASDEKGGVLKNLDKNTLAEIKKAWGNDSTVGSIQYQAKSAMEAKRKTYLDNKKEKTKGWLKYLRDQFPTVDDNQTALENAFISNDILNNTDYSAYKTLTKILAFAGMNTSTKWSKGNVNRNLLTSSSTIHNNLLLDFKSQFADKTISELENLSLTGLSSTQQLSIINLVNSIGGKNAIKSSTSEQSPSFKVEYIDNVAEIKNFTNLFNSISNSYAKKQISNKDIAIGSLSDFMSTSDLEALLTNDLPFGDFLNWKGVKPTKLTEVVNYIPEYTIENEKVELKATESTNDGRVGLLNESQRYLSNKYFTDKKPVAVSEIVLKFNNTSVDIKKEISSNLFINPESDTNTLLNYFKGFGKFYVDIVKNDKIEEQTGLSLFDSFYRGANSGTLLINSSNEWASSYLTSKKDAGILTVDNESYSNVAKYAIYDFLNGGKGTKAIDGGFDHASTNIPESALKDKAVAFADPNFKKLTGLVEATRRFADVDQEASNSGSNIYSVVNSNLGIIAYIESDGLHFAKIDGYSLMKPENNVTENQESVSTTDDLDKKESIAYDAIFSTSNAYSTYILNRDLVTESSSKTNEGDPTRAWDIKNQEVIDKIKNMNGVNDYKNVINYNIKNRYERFLVNSSIAKNKNTTGSLYDFDYLTDLTSALSNTDGDFKELGQWMWLYLKDVLNKDDEGLFETFFETEKEVDKKGWKAIIEQIANIDKVSDAKISSSFDKKNKSWVEDVKNNFDVQNNIILTDQAKKFIPNQTLKADYETTIQGNTIWSKTKKVQVAMSSIQFVFNYDNVSLKMKGDE
ncbi:hypothetical protein EELLY_v1c07320 [Entomoplasma ellychniae]|uniref:Lipoprotein n=1 Tax=Entomoplasma ellychniae TaxID=2114 RepID=A0A8E2QZ12_9MOLU|nr:lipoprotein [Entomoplasma ellychniae]PPE05044.1 hypothetical protein EELLY_v1c07320 [Entomoplasma ellychniae]